MLYLWGLVIKLVDILFLFLMTLLGSFGGFYLKKSSYSKHIISPLKNKYLYIGIFLYFLSSLLNIYLLKQYSYIFVFTFTSVTYIWSIIIGNLFLKEIITQYKIIGILLICLGVYFIGLSSR